MNNLETFGLTNDEAKALLESVAIIRYATEHVDDLNPALAKIIGEAREAAMQNRWSPEISAAFWDAFHQLCVAIRPVTTECLAASQENVFTIRFPKFTRERVSLADRSSNRYSISLIVLSSAALLLQFYVWIGQQEIKNISSIEATIENTFNGVSTTYIQRLVPALSVVPRDARMVRDLTFTVCGEFSNIATDITQLQFDSGILLAFPLASQNVHLHYTDMSGLAEEKSKSKHTCEEFPDKVSGEYLRIRGARNNARQDAGYTIEEARLISYLLVSYVLPVLLGSIGAIAYILRQISEQIRRTTFSRTTPLQHWVRVMMGALAGLVVGLFGNAVSTNLSLPPLAFAFLAGYGVEALFAVFDDMISRLRSPTASRHSP